MPLVWVHAEFLTLVIAANRGEPVERFNAVTERYVGKRLTAMAWRWYEEMSMECIAAGRDLLLEASEPAALRVSLDGDERNEPRSEVQPIGLHGVCFQADGLNGRETLAFRYSLDSVWERQNRHLAIGGA